MHPIVDEAGVGAFPPPDGDRHHRPGRGRGGAAGAGSRGAGDRDRASARASSVASRRSPRIALAALYEAGSDVLEVGGDWYDAFELADGRIVLTVGDVVGHGLAAAAAMGQVRTALAALAYHAAGPGELLERLDGFLARTRTTDFATVCYAVLDPATGVVEYASAGHPPMIVVSPAGSTIWLDRRAVGPAQRRRRARSPPGIGGPRTRFPARPLLGRACRTPQGAVRGRPRAARRGGTGRRGAPRRGGLPHARRQARGRRLARR